LAGLELQIPRRQRDIGANVPAAFSLENDAKMMVFAANPGFARA
jgi:hypothetical protein